MNTRILLITLLIGINITLTAEEITKEELLKKIEVIEAELEMIKIDNSDNDPIQTGKIQNWGTGLSFGVQFCEPANIGAEIMYNFQLGSSDKKSERPLILGLGVLAKRLKYEDVYPFSTWQRALRVGYTIGPKISLNSPVLLNFISFSTNIIPYVLFAEIEHQGYFAEVEFGLEFGAEINFWYNHNMNFSIGGSFDPSLYKIDGNRVLTNPLEYSINFGTNFYF